MEKNVAVVVMSRSLFIVASWVLTGMAVGFLSTTYGAVRRQYRIASPIKHFLDWLIFVVIALAMLIVGFWTDWGDFKLWLLPAMGLGYGLWAWGAAPVVYGAMAGIMFWQARLLFWVMWPFRRLIGVARRLLGRWFDRLDKSPPAA